MDTDDVDVIYNVILLSHKKEQNAICSNVDGPGYGQEKEGKKSEKKKKEKYHMTLLICGILRKW